MCLASLRTQGVRNEMSDPCRTEIEKAIREAAETGHVLYVSRVATDIAGRCVGVARTIATQLTEAGIKARVTMQFGMPK